MASIFGLLAGPCMDRVIPDPQRGHPVAIFGACAAEAEKIFHPAARADTWKQVSAGAAYTTMLVGAVSIPVWVISVKYPRAVPLIHAVSLWAVMGGSTLQKVAEQLATHLQMGRVEQARELIPWLCGRDPQVLSAEDMARATCESVAENLVDADTAPLLISSLLGPAGAVGYRAINTLDAMVGYKNERYLYFGKPSARLDDVANFVPARLTALLIVGCASVLPGYSGVEAWKHWRSDAAAHPSPNAGVVEAAIAGACGLKFGGETVYAHGTEIRPELGFGLSPQPHHITQVTTLTSAVRIAAVLTACAIHVART